MASEPMTTEELEDATRYVEYGETKFGEGWAEERNIPLLRRLLDENARLNAENNMLKVQLHNSKMCALRELEAQIRGDEAEAERDALAAKLSAGRQALVDNVAEYDREIASFTLPTTMSRDDEEHRDLTRAEAKEARWCLEAFDAALAAPEMPRPPAEEADALAKHEAAIAEYVRACKADGCSCYPIASNTKVISHWCRIHGVLSIVPAELTWTNPGIRGGEPCMRGTRVPVEQICTLLEDGATWEFVKETYPSIPTPEGHREATQPGADGTDTSPAGSGRGTGVAEAPETSHVIEFENTDIRAVDIEHPLLGDNIETEYLGETNGIHRWRLTNPAPGTNSITFPSLPVPSTEATDER